MVREKTDSFKKILGLIVFLLCVEHSHGAKILFMSVMSSKSVKTFQEPLIYELASRDHQVTVLSPFATSKKHNNIRDVLGPDFLSLGDLKDFSSVAFETRRNVNPFMPMFRFMGSQGISCDVFYQEPQVQGLMKEKFDLVIATYSFNECGFGMLHHFGVPFILIHANVPLPNANPTGMPFPLSHVPLPFLGYTDNMNFWQRVVNFATGKFLIALDVFWRIPMVEKAYQKHVPGAPSVDKIAANVSLIFANSHFSLNFPRPLMPDVIEVGGMHCKQAKSLPEDLEKFVEGSGDDGFIFFSLGSVLTASRMPEGTRKAILSAFSKLKQRVIWKWETETMDDLPPNVKLGKWLPQQDILGHPKCRAFISHGGLHSLEEAIYHGVPLIGMPMFGDQDSNLRLAAHFNLSLTLEFSQLTEETILTAVRTVLRDPTYREGAARMSQIFRDRLDQPLDAAVFYTEYVLKHNGARHLRSPARKLNYFQYNSLDAIAFIFLILFSILFTIYVLLKCLFKCTIGRWFSKKLSSKGQKQKKN